MNMSVERQKIAKFIYYKMMGKDLFITNVIGKDLFIDW